MRTLEGSAVAGREQHIGELYDAHSLRALRLAYVLTGSREVAEDLIQEAFLRAFDRLDSLRQRDAFPAYLRTTILNLVRAHFRRKRIERLATRRHDLISWQRIAELPDVGERDRVWRVLQSLPFRQRAALVLRYYEDLSEKDAAQVLGTSVAALKSLVSRGTKAVRTELERGERTDDD